MQVLRKNIVDALSFVFDISMRANQTGTDELQFVPCSPAHCNEMCSIQCREI